MNLNFYKEKIKDDLLLELINILNAKQTDYHLTDSEIYHDYPLVKNDDNALIAVSFLIVSRVHGVFIFSIGGDIDSQHKSEIDVIYSNLYSKFIRNKKIVKERIKLLFEMKVVIYQPESMSDDVNDSIVIHCEKELDSLFKDSQMKKTLELNIYNEILATLDGSKGLINSTPRQLSGSAQHGKGYIANLCDDEIKGFDNRQKLTYMVDWSGFQRIRGLAGSGKTIILSMKAAVTHLKHPEATIVYTFYTKSLYQHIKLLITRFYRKHEDKDPDWDKLIIMHAWGGSAFKGVYSSACDISKVKALTYRDAVEKDSAKPFDFACKTLMKELNTKHIYDYILIDEGQDFPVSFISLCLKLSNNVVYAYDDMQTIFQPVAPSADELKKELGVDVDFTTDIVLPKCYRNPREILVVAHAIGFGIYGEKLVQMVETKGQWEDIGYKVISGDFVDGSKVIVERPQENSLKTISEKQKINELIIAKDFSEFKEEVAWVVDSIAADIREGLRPEDILIIIIDDRNARGYIEALSEYLSNENINTNNMHSDIYNLKNFRVKDCVTLSTVYKAKGNEAHMVYIMGIDAMYGTYAGVVERNMMFTAMTRTKGWVRITGVGESAEQFCSEVEVAKENFPYLKFEYNEKCIKIIKRDLEESARKKLSAEKHLDQIGDTLTPDEAYKYLVRKNEKKI